MGRLVGLVFGLIAIVNGLRVLFASNCSSVSFGSGGGSRVAIAQCFSDSSGAIPSWLAGIGMILVGFAILSGMAKSQLSN